MQKTASLDRWLSLGAACQVVGVNGSTLRQWADSGLLQTFRTPGGHRRFLREDLVTLLESRTVKRPADAAHQPSLSDRALRRIRRRLHEEQTGTPRWYEALDDTTLGRLRLFGRRLLDLTTEYLTQRRRRPELLEEVRLIGEEYGEEMARHHLPLRDVLETFLFFRHSLLDSVRESARRGAPYGEDVSQALQPAEAMADELLLAMADAYERSGNASTLSSG